MLRVNSEYLKVFQFYGENKFSTLDLERPSLCPSPSNCRIGSALSAFWANFCFSRCYFKILNLKIEINSCGCDHTGREIAIEVIGLDPKKSFSDCFAVLF